MWVHSTHRTYTVLIQFECVCTRVSLMYDGRVVCVAKPETQTKYTSNTPHLQPPIAMSKQTEKKKRRAPIGACCHSFFTRGAVHILVVHVGLRKMAGHLHVQHDPLKSIMW